MNRKTIQVNPIFLQPGRRLKRSRERKKKPAMAPGVRPNNIKKQLLAKIKAHQKRAKEKLELQATDAKERPSPPEKAKTTFSDQMKYVEDMIKEKNEKKARRTLRRRERKAVREAEAQRNVAPLKAGLKAPTVNVPSITTREPPYGNLKNGSKPTYAQYRQTLRRKKPKVTLAPLNIPSPTPEAERRQKKLEEVRGKIIKDSPSVDVVRMINKKRTIKIFSLGKKGKKVGVLIKSGKTRKLVKNEHTALRKHAISEIKSYLRKHNLIKAGSQAPEDILRKLYEDSFLAGDIYNRNAETLLHNYINDQP